MTFPMQADRTNIRWGVVFDLDDTLFKEIDFVFSGYRHIATELQKQVGHDIYPEMLALHEQKKMVFQVIAEKYQTSQSESDFLQISRTHFPDIELVPGATQLLTWLKAQGVYLGLLTDGRSVTQRNKIKALGLDRFINDFVISEEFGSRKPAPENYLHFSEPRPGFRCVYVGDNFEKDFVTPNRLGWHTIALRDDGRNIHPQASAQVESDHAPRMILDSFGEIRKTLPKLFAEADDS